MTPELDRAGTYSPVNGRVVIIYRMVPHYRLELYSGLASKFDLKVATASNVPKGTMMKFVAEYDWLHRYELLWNKPSELYSFVKVPTGQILKDLRPELVITEGSMSTSATFNLLLHRMRYGWPKVVFWGHGWQMGRGFRSLADKLSQYLRLIPYALANGHITYCEEGAAWLRKFLTHKPIHVARNTQNFSVKDDEVEASIQRSEAGDRPFTVLATGRLTPDKDFPKLVRLFASFHVAQPHSQLLIVGDGPDREAIEAEIKCLPPNAVVAKGAVYDPDELKAIFLSADCAAYAGSVGLAVNHALAYGLPFLTFKRGAEHAPYHHPEYAYIIDGETGYRAKDQYDFEKHLNVLASDRSVLAALRRSSRRYYRDKLRMDDYVNQFTQAISHHLYR